MDRDQKRELIAIMALEFTAVEFNLYLDTHPDDRKALNDFYSTNQQLKKLKRDYESKYGPLTVSGRTPNKQAWKWICDPWPWEMVF
ncbi:MAG: spore coat protein CotJB [Firmicutes bacterium]|nr:spore coat protein CotJB [Bacillota bacterium]